MQQDLSVVVARNAIAALAVGMAHESGLLASIASLKGMKGKLVHIQTLISTNPQEKKQYLPAILGLTVPRLNIQPVLVCNI